MPNHGPLILLQSSHDRMGGIVPPNLLVQAAAEVGYRVAALVDTGTLQGGPSFLEACARNHMLGLAGMTVLITPPSGLAEIRSPDVFDLLLSPNSLLKENVTMDSRLRGNDRISEILRKSSFPRRRESMVPKEQRVIQRIANGTPACACERAALLAVNHAGFRNLLKIKQAWDLSAEKGVHPEVLLNFCEGVFLVAGLAGSALQRIPTNRADRERFAWMSTFLEQWPHDQVGLCCFDSRTGGIIETATTSPSRSPLPIPPLACVQAAYRTQHDRFWGCAARLTGQGNVTSSRDLPGRIPHAERVVRLLQGLTPAFRGVEKLTAKPFDPYQHSGLTFPVYPVPRGTDAASFFWTLGQETAIATGHIRREGVKERLVEEFQYLKQTRWPTVWLLLWDVRKRLGLPPGTLRPTAEWTTSSLFAHLLGLTRVDPYHEGISFHPGVQDSLHAPVEVDCPHQWEQEVLASLNALLGKGRCGFAAPAPDDHEDLVHAGYRLLAHWEDLEFPGDPPDKLPPLPSFLDQGGGSTSSDAPASLIVSAVNLEQVFAPAKTGYPELDTDPIDALTVGTLVLRLLASNTQTLSCAPFYRDTVPVLPRREESRESITTWIEKHRGEVFRDQGYADDTGKIEVLGLSASLLRLLTIPGSTGYRPLLWRWICAAMPTFIGELADLLALAWHWSFWTQRENLRLIAVQREHPLRSEGGVPPWWEDWTRSADESGLDARIRGDVGAALERFTQGTGGWLLYREQIHQVGTAALRLTAEEMDLWLSLEEGGPQPDPVSSRDQHVWDRNTRETVVQFLGNPNPLPSRPEFLRKAEQLLAMADAFARDPAAMTAILSYLYPGETEDRRELYSLLRARGTRLDPPRAVPGGRYDFSPSTGQLRLGTQNILGVGPQISMDLEASYPSSLQGGGLRDLFQPPPTVPDLSWEEWLKSWPEHRLSWNLLSQLIRLGVFEPFGHNTGALLTEARARHLSLRAQGGGAAQQTLFPVRPGQAHSTTAAIVGPDSLSLHHEEHLELSLLRLGIIQNPLEPFREWFPQEWFAEGGLARQPDWLQMGWVHEVDVFATAGEPQPGGVSQSPWVTFLLFNQETVYRVVDESGKVLSLLPHPIPEAARLDGYRMHLKEPWPLFCEVRSRPYTGQGLPQYLLRECETPALLGNASESWSQIKVVLEDSTAEVLEQLSLFLRWFSGGERGIPLVFENGAGIIKRSGVRRLISRLGSPRVVPSTVLLDRLKSLRGIRAVVVIERQADLFTTPPGSPISSIS